MWNHGNDSSVSLAAFQGFAFSGVPLLLFAKRSLLHEDVETLETSYVAARAATSEKCLAVLQQVKEGYLMTQKFCS